MDQILEELEQMAGIETIHLDEKTSNSLSILIKSWDYFRNGDLDSYELKMNIQKRLQRDDIEISVAQDSEEWAKVLIEKI